MACWTLLVMVALSLCSGSGTALADEPGDYAFDQRPGASVPLDRTFTGADGRPRRLGGVFGQRPVILALGYFHCPTLCGLGRNDLLEALSQSGLRPAADYDLLVVSIDPAETPADAAATSVDDRQRYPADGSEAGWHYLTGDAASIAALANAVGFRSRYDVQLKQFLHPAGLVVLTPDGSVSGYVLGIGYRAGDVRAAVTLASTGGLAKTALPLLLLCFHYDAATGRYSLAVMKVLQLAGLVTVAVMGGTLFLALRRERRNV